MADAFYYKTIDGVKLLICRALEELSVPHGFSNLEGGVSKGIYASMNLGFNRGDKTEDVLKNYELFCLAAGLSGYEQFGNRQVHGNNVIRLFPEDSSKIGSCALEADGFITNAPNKALFVYYADCVPILFYDKVKKVAGAVHSGWRGTAGRIAEAAVCKFKNEFGSESSDIIAAIGPCICADCYQVGREVKAEFKNAGLDAAIDGRLHADLALANKIMLEQAGLAAENIYISNLCTRCSGDFFSHRRSGNERGVCAAAIGLPL